MSDVARPPINVDKGLPLPPLRIGRPPIWPWKEMEVGDSFAVPTDCRVHIARVAAAKAGKQFGRKFTVRKVDGQLRCWRIA